MHGYCSMSRSRVYDNWGKLVEATLDREKLRQLALSDSMETSFRTSVSSSFGSCSSFDFEESNSPNYIATGYMSFISAPTLLTYEVIKAADSAAIFRKECQKLKHKTQQLEVLLQQVAEFASGVLYDRPMHYIMDETREVLSEAFVLTIKCKGGGLRRRLFTKITTAAFNTISSHLEHCIHNITWLLRDDEYRLGVPPISFKEPILFHIWQMITILHNGSAGEQCDAVAASIVSMLSKDHSSRKLFIEEDGVLSLSKLLKEGTVIGQENAARALGLLVKVPKCVQLMLKCKIWNEFCHILEGGPLKVQAAVAWTISEIAENWHLEFFLEGRTVQLLVSHLAFHGVLYDNTNHAFVNNFPTSTEQGEGTDKEDHVLKEYIFAMADRTLWQLIKSGDYSISSKIVNANAMSHLAILLNKGLEESRDFFIVALMEITEVASKYALFESYFKPNTDVRKAIVDLLLRVSEMEDSDLLVIPCIEIVRNLAPSFVAATEIRMIISTLVKLLHNHQSEEVCKEACITLVKFGEFISLVYCKELIGANGTKCLVQLTHSEDEILQTHALILLCIVVRHLPKSIDVADAGVLTVFSWALKHEPFKKNKDVKRLLPLAAKQVGIPVSEDLIAEPEIS